MIQKLRISNFALIQDLELHLNDGFTVLTGETGSGKSILLNAFSLLLGERAHSSLVGAYGKKAIVEAVIDATPGDQFFLRRTILILIKPYLYVEKLFVMENQEHLLMILLFLWAL